MPARARTHASATPSSASARASSRARSRAGDTVADTGASNAVADTGASNTVADIRASSAVDGRGARITLGTLRTMRWAKLAAFVVVATLAACTRVDLGREGGVAALRTNLSRARELELQTATPELSTALRPALARLARLDEAHRFVAGSGRAVPRVVVAVTPLAEPIRALARRVGVEDVDADGPRSGAANPPGAGAADPARTGAFRFAGQTFDERHDALVATFEDPERPGLPVTIVIGNDVRAVCAAAGDLLPGWKPWVRALRSGETVVSGPLDRDGNVRPAELARIGFARLANERVLEPLAVVAPGVVGRADRALSNEDVARYLSTCVRARERAVTWIAPEAGIPTAEVALWADVDGYLFDGDPDALSRCDPVDERVHAWLARTPRGPLDDGGAGVVRAGAWNRLGAPSEPWMLDAAAVEAARSWWGNELDAWLARVRDAGGEIDVARLVDERTDDHVSAHVLIPRRAALWRYLRETRGDAHVRDLWIGRARVDVDAESTRAFDTWLAQVVERALAPVELERQTARAARARGGPWRGVGVADPLPDAPWLPRAGLERRETSARPSPLDEAALVNANAVLFHAFVRDESGVPTLFADARSRRFATRAGDVRLVADLLSAEVRGYHTMLVPHLLAGEGGTWAGSWTRGDRDDWRAYFERSARLGEHTGSLAHLGGADILSLESGQWSVTGLPEGRRAVAEEGTWRAEGWRTVLRGARAVFDGALTYSASSPDELSRVTFLGELDLVSLELAPSLARLSPQDSQGARIEIGNYLETALYELERVATAHRKPALVTQATFRPELYGAARFQAGHPTSTAWQALQYRELAARLAARRERFELQGLFAWRVGAPGFGDEHDVRIASDDVREAVRSLLAQ